MHTRSLAVIFAVLPAAVQAQSVSADLRAGMCASVGGIGTAGVTRGELRTVPSAAFGVDFRSPGALLGIRLSGAFGVSSGTNFSPTPECTSGCGARSIVSGSFVGLAADLTAERQTERWTFRLGMGPGIVSYYYGDQGFTGLCPTGSMCDDYFRTGDTRVAFHAGGTVGRRVGSVTLVATLENYLSKRVGGGASNDLNVSLGFGIGSLWSRKARR